MTLKARYIAQALFELTEGATKERAEKAVASVVRFLRSRGRLSMLERVVAEYRKLLVCRNKTNEVMMRSTAPLSEKIKEAVREAVDASADASVKETIDPSLTGGVVAKYNDALLDASLKTKLKQLEEALLR